MFGYPSETKQHGQDCLDLSGARAVRPLFDGSGAARFGARWTSPGRQAIYASGSYACALLEMIAHARRYGLQEPYNCLRIEIPDAVKITTLNPEDVPGWDSADYVASRAVGDAWLDRAESAVLRIPSVVGHPYEWNAVINPMHADVRLLVRSTPHPVVWDDRLLAL